MNPDPGQRLNPSRRLIADIRSLSCLTLCAILSSLMGCTADEPYQYFVTGDPGNVEAETRGLIVMQGGGDDVDENYIQMGALGGGGDFVVLAASGGDQYNDYIYKLCDCDSVETIEFADREAAFDPFVIETIRNAEAIFISGGDQSNYMKFWKDTPVMEAINFVAAKPAPIGGTSAGMAVLGEFVYTAMTESVTADLSLQDPYYDDITLDREFLQLPGMNNIITDQHLQERDRIGRTLAFMARLLQDGWTTEARAIAADRETAVHFDPVTRLATVFATADHETPYVYFMRSSAMPEQCTAGEPLTFRNVEVYRLGVGGSFDVVNWEGSGGIQYELSAENGGVTSSRGEVY
jgi:cyanophycinase-like exopeptidase